MSEKCPLGDKCPACGNYSYDRMNCDWSRYCGRCNVKLSYRQSEYLKQATANARREALEEVIRIASPNEHNCKYVKQILDECRDAIRKLKGEDDE